jgi:hypothetical protein
VLLLEKSNKLKLEVDILGKKRRALTKKGLDPQNMLAFNHPGPALCTSTDSDSETRGRHTDDLTLYPD